jgi:hypothetical protein
MANGLFVFSGRKYADQVRMLSAVYNRRACCFSGSRKPWHEIAGSKPNSNVGGTWLKTLQNAPSVARLGTRRANWIAMPGSNALQSGSCQ